MKKCSKLTKMKNHSKDIEVKIIPDIDLTKAIQQKIYLLIIHCHLKIIHLIKNIQTYQILMIQAQKRNIMT